MFMCLNHSINDIYYFQLMGQKKPMAGASSEISHDSDDQDNSTSCEESVDLPEVWTKDTYAAPIRACFAKWLCTANSIWHLRMLTPGPATGSGKNGPAGAKGTWDMVLSFLEACVFRHVHTTRLDLSGFADGAKTKEPGVATGTRKILLSCRRCELAITRIYTCCALGASTLWPCQYGTLNV